MFFYNFNNLDDFINNTLTKNLVEERIRIDDIISLYYNKKVNLLNITNNMISVTNILDKNKINDFYNTITLLKDSFETLESITNYSEILKKSLANISDLCSNGIESNYNEIKANLVEYNKQDEKLYHQIMEYEKNITNVLNSTIEITLSVTNCESTNIVAENISNATTHIEKNVFGDNDILVVSEKEQVAYLPYKLLDVENIYKNNTNKYSSVEDVIEKLYVISLNKFKNSSLSRFREAFNLIKHKEKGSITKALDLGLELMFNYDLNPIIIAACRNIDELDIYLDCLEENELDDFSCFEIRFEVSPQLSKVKRKEYY